MLLAVFLCCLPLFYDLLYRPSSGSSPSTLDAGLPLGFIEFTRVNYSYIRFRDSNGPSSSAILHFHDLLLCLLLPVLYFVLASVYLLLFQSPTHRFLIDHQPSEFLWTLLPTLSLFCLSLPSLSLLYLLDEVGNPAFTSKIQGHQWYWHYESHDTFCSSYDSYLTPGPLRLLNTDTVLTVPHSLVLRLLVTAADVLHSWTIPSWGLKVDAVPGRLNQLSTVLDRPGIFFGQCSEVCGANHSFMPISAEVLS